MSTTRELSIHMPDGETRVIPLTGRRITLGRTSDNDLAFPDEAILSRRHIAIDSDGYAIGVWTQNDGTRYNINAVRFQ